MLEIGDPRRRWIASRTPAINPAFALVEAFWIAGGRNDIWLPAFWNPRLPLYCGNTSSLEGAYGHRLRAHFGVDQLDRVYRALDAQPDSRQIVLQLWDAQADLPANDGTPARGDIPCNVMAIPKVRAGRLEWLQIMRSNDVFRGLPYNVVQFTMLQEFLAGWLGVQLGSYHHLSDSLHIYIADMHEVQASSFKVAVPEDSMSFALPRADWDVVIAAVLRRLDILTLPSANRETFRKVALTPDVPVAYEDAVRIAAADAARRRGWIDIAEECASACENEALTLLWNRWMSRVRGATLTTNRELIAG
jgi:thymidylate synthase